MPTWSSFGAFGKELEKVHREIQLAEKLKITRKMAEQAKGIADDAAAAELPGMKFRNWPPKLDLQVKAGKDGSSTLLPTRSGAGPWTVLQSGRHQGNASGFSGPGINIRTGKTSRTKSGGLRKVRATKGKRWNGVTRGRGTADAAVKRMEAELPKIAEDGIRKVLQRHFDVT